MREHPLLMQGPLVLATLNGIKTQTRRPLRCLSNDEHMGKLLGDWHLSKPPYQYNGGPLWRWKGKREPKSGDWAEKVQTDVDDTISVPVKGIPSVGDRLWVRETFIGHPACPETGRRYSVIYKADGGHPEGYRWAPSIHMPRKACRLVLPLVSVRVERVQDITEEDAKAEGVEPVLMRGIGSYPEWMRPTMREVGGHQKAFELLWKKIYGDASWDANPWVWVAEWKDIEART